MSYLCSKIVSRPKERNEMPNWSFNSLSISGNPEEIAQVKFQVSQPFTREHENWNPETKQMEVKTYTYDNPVFAFWNIIRPTDMEAYAKQPDRTLPLEEQLKFKGKDWYSWNVTHWGTKWDVAVSNGDEWPETQIQVDNSDHLIYSFNTAWSPPEEVVAELSRQFPNLTFDMEYEEETGWGGDFTYKAGEVVAQRNYDSRCPDCDEHNCIDYDEEAGEQFCTKCDYRS